MKGENPLLPIGAADTMTHGVPYNDRTTHTYPTTPPGTPWTASPAPGSVVIDRPGVTILNTRLMQWDPHSSIGNSYLKVLSRNEQDEPILVLWYLPPGLAGSELPHRGYHDYRECAYILEGELRHWEYDDASSDQGALITFREGLFLDRMANSLHGVEDEISSKTGCTILFMRSLHMPFIGDQDWRERHTLVR